MDIAVFLAVLIAAAGLGGVVGLLFGRHLWPAIRRDDAAALDAARFGERADLLQQRLDDEAAKRALAEADARAAGAEAARLRQREADLTAQLVDVQHKLTGEFENIANRILKATTSELSQGSQRE